MDGEKKRKNTSPQTKARKEHKKGDTSNGHTSNEKEGSYDDIAHLKHSALNFLSSHTNNGDDLLAPFKHSTTGDVYDKFVTKAQEFSTESSLIQEIQALLLSHKFNRAHFLDLLLDSNHPLPPLLFVQYLHNNDIVTLSYFLEKLPPNKTQEFADLLKESYFSTGDSRKSIFDDILIALVNLDHEKSPKSRVPEILTKLYDQSKSTPKTKTLNVLLHSLQRVARMRPESLSEAFFLNRLHGLLWREASAADLSALEAKAKSVLNPISETDKGKAAADLELNSILQKVFSQLAVNLPISEIVRVIASAVSGFCCDWDILTNLIRYLISEVRDFGSHMAEQLHKLAADAFSNVNKDLLRVVLVLSWLVLASNPYTEWFSANFCAPATSLATSKNLKQLLAKTMTSLASIESPELSKCHRAIIKKFPEMKPIMNDYLAATRSEPVASFEGKTPTLDDAISSAKACLEQFRQEGTVPAKLKNQLFFKPTILPTLLSLEEEQKVRPVPEFKDVHLFVAALQSQGVISQSVIANWKATQSDHTAKVRSSLRLAKSRLSDKDKSPLDILKSRLQEFVDRARVNKTQSDGSLLTEIATRVTDLSANSTDQAIQCVNLLLQTFCEASNLLSTEVASAGVKVAGKVVGLQWSGDFVRRVIMLPKLRPILCDRLRELTSVLALELDDTHVACLALFMAHLASTNEENPMTEDASFVHEIFRKVYANIRNARWMAFAAKLCSRFVMAIPAVSSFVLAPDSYSDSQDESYENTSSGPHDYSLVPPLVFKILIWLKTRYEFGQQVASLCSSNTTLHQHNPVYSDFSSISTLLSAFPSSAFSKTLVTRSGIFTIEELVLAEMRISTCGDFLDSTWKVEYLRKVILEHYADTQPKERIESLLGAIFDAERSDEVCPCGKVGECNGKAAVMTTFGESVDSENGIDWTLTFMEKQLEQPIKSQTVLNVVSVLSKGLQAISHIHPSVFATNISVLKNFLYVIGGYLKFLVPFQSGTLPHELTHSSTLVFVFLARIFGYLAHKQPQWASSIKELITRAPHGFFFAVNCPVYRKISLSQISNSPVISDMYSELESVHSLVGAVFQTPRVAALEKLEKTISAFPVLSAHVLFHSTFTFYNLQTIPTLPLQDKVAKLEAFFSSIINSTRAASTLEEDTMFQFLASFTDLLIYFLTTSPSFNNKQALLSPPTSKRESTEDLVEGLLITLLLSQPRLLCVFRHPIPISTLATARTSLFPVFSSSTFSRYSFTLFLVLTSISITTLGKVMKGEVGTSWKEIMLESYEKCKKHPHESHMYGSFIEQAEKWICGLIEKFGVEPQLATRFLPSLSSISPSVSQSLQHFTNK